MIARIPNAIFLALILCLTVGFGFSVGWSSRHHEAKVQIVGQTAQGNESHNRHAALEDWLTHDAAGFFTMWLVIVGFGQAGLFLWQLFLIKRSLRPAEVAAQAAMATAEALIDNERPWVGPITTSSKQIAPGQFIDACVVIQNSGHTPALEMRAAFKGSIKSKTASADQPDIAQAPPKALFPHVPDWHYPFSKSLILSAVDFDAIRDGDKIAWIVGRIEYLDNRERHRYTNICTRWDQGRGVFVPHETGNDAT